MKTERPLRCDCGYEVAPGPEAEVVAAIRRHAWQAHGIAFSEADALLVVLRAALERDDRGGPADAGPRG